MDKLDIKALARHIKENEKQRAAVFNEDRLRADIVKTWGEHGAHVEVYDRILSELDLVRKDRDHWRKAAERISLAWSVESGVDEKFATKDVMRTYEETPSEDI